MDIGKAARLEDLLQRRDADRLVPQLRKLAAGEAFLGLLLSVIGGREHQRLKFALYPRQVSVECLTQSAPVSRAHRTRKLRARGFVAGQSVGLHVAQHLQAILEHPQVAICNAELFDHTQRQQTTAAQLRQDFEQPGILQTSILTTPDQLHRLHDELDLTDTASAELDVIEQVFAGDLLFDELLHFPQALEDTEIEIATIDEWPYGLLV